MKLFKRKKKAKKDIFEQGNFNISDIKVDEDRPLMTSLLYANDFVNVVYPACAACYGISESKNKTREERIEYIARRVKTKHTSILEHGNVVVQAFIPIKDVRNLAESVYLSNRFIQGELTDHVFNNTQDIITLTTEVFDQCRYLTHYTDIIEDENGGLIMRITFGGSIRGYRYIFENIENRQNKLFISIFDVLKRVVPSAFFIDFIMEGVMDDYETIEITKKLSKNIRMNLEHKKNTDYLDIITMDSLTEISDILNIDKEKCFDFVSTTVNFKYMSRIITQQVTRHRNGVTQESQRYVNYKDSGFNTPIRFKPDKYSDDKVYKTRLGELNLYEIADVMMSVYEDLVEQGVEKEDARGYLPENVQCGKLFMTFNLRTLIMFLHLRLDSHAQAEVRMYAEKLADLTDSYARELKLDDMYMASAYYSEPLYKRLENQDLYKDIDEEV